MLVVVNQIVGLIDTPASAQAVTHQANDIINPINTMWVLVTAFLVFFMQAGFMMLEAGFARTRETVNILLECIVDTCLCGLLFWAFGFAFMFGAGNGWIGHQYFFLNGAPATYGSTGVAFLAFFLFQFAFADTCSTITSGAMVGRTGFGGDLLYSFGVSGFIYPIIGHWVWGPGRLAQPRITHSAVPRLRRLDRRAHHRRHDRPRRRHRPRPAPRPQVQAGRRRHAARPRHDDRRRRRRDPVVRLVRLQPGLDAVGDGLRGHRPGRAPTRRWPLRRRVWSRCSASIRGARSGTPASRSTASSAGLVAITCPCYWVSPVRRDLIGAIAGVIVVLGGRLHRVAAHRRPDRRGGGPRLLRHLGHAEPRAVRHRSVRPARPDRRRHVGDRRRACSTAAACEQLVAQIIGSCLRHRRRRSASAWSLMYAVKATGTLRVSEEGELEGIDIHEHGAPAYHLEPGLGTNVVTVDVR